MEKQTETLYRRVVSESGRVRYVPSYVEAGWDALAPGIYLLDVRTVGHQSRVKIDTVKPDNPGFIALCHRLRDEIAMKLSEAAKLRPSKRVTSVKEREIFDKWIAELDSLGLCRSISLEAVSMYEIADAAIEALENA